MLPRGGGAEAHLDRCRREAEERSRWERVVARRLAIWQTMKVLLEHCEVEKAERARQAVQREAQETQKRWSFWQRSSKG